MFSLIKTLFFPLTSLIILILGTGFFSTFISLRLDIANASSAMIGLITAAFYAGVLLSSLLAPTWIKKLGHLRLWILLCGLNGIVILFHAAWIQLAFWLFLRFLGGLIMGGFFVVIESWFLLLSPSSKRSLTLSIYVFMYYIATSSSQLFLKWCEPLSLTPYYLAAALSALAIIPCILRPLKIPTHGHTQYFSLLGIIRASFKGFFGGFISGMLLACVYGLAPIYGKQTGLSVPEIGTMMALIVLGGLSFQLPLGKWADAFSRRWVMIVACFATALFGTLLAAVAPTSGAFHLILLWLFGGFAFALYPLSMSFACEKIPDHHIVAITGGFNLIYGIGAVIGPLLAPLFMTWLGACGLFYFIALICFAMALIGSIPHHTDQSSL